MTNAEAQTRPDRWRVFPHANSYRVGRVVDDAGTVSWHRGRLQRGALMRLHGTIISFRKRAHAEARACRLNLADAEATGYRLNPSESGTVKP